MEGKLQEAVMEEEPPKVDEAELKIVVPGDFIGEGYVAGNGTYVNEDNP